MQDMRVAVIGAGLMGHAIAYMLAAAGHPVALQDPSKETLATVPDRFAQIAETLGDENDAIDRVCLFSNLAEAVEGAGMVVKYERQRGDIIQIPVFTAVPVKE